MQTIMIFQQNDSGKTKIAGINQFGDKEFQLKIFNVEPHLPEVIDDGSVYLPDTIEADLVLDYLTHRDLSEDLSLLCEELNIPVIASGRKITRGGALCPPTCCTLADHKDLGDYGKLFGAPKVGVKTQGETLKDLEVMRGAPCGATWLAAQKVKGMDLEEALTRFGLEVQFFCSANPANWDPIWGKSPVHIAADIQVELVTNSACIVVLVVLFVILLV